MARHKWKPEIETEWGTKPHSCVKCGITKYWRGGDYQSWEYVWNRRYTAINGEEYWETKRSWTRPECDGKEKI